jgi:hypothetical protein
VNCITACTAPVCYGPPVTRTRASYLIEFCVIVLLALLAAFAAAN